MLGRQQRRQKRPGVLPGETLDLRLLLSHVSTVGRPPKGGMGPSTHLAAASRFRPMPGADEFLTVAEVAAILKLNQRTIRNGIDDGKPPALHSERQRGHPA